MRRSAALLALALVVSGCLQSAPEDATPTPSREARDARVVIGLVDSGINPYHEAFRAEGWTPPPALLDSVAGRAPVVVRLSQDGNFSQKVDADEELWATLEPRVLYWFEGTRVLGYSVAPSSWDVPVILDREFHGTAVASVASAAATDAWIVMVEASTADDEVFAQRAGRISEGVDWLASQPWVDIVSLSLGLSVPGYWEIAGYPEATKKAAESGKVVVNAAGNNPTPRMVSGAEDVPWVIGVGGIYEAARAEVAQARKHPDVVAEYRRQVAGRDGYWNTSGTSLSAPLVAGSIAQTLQSLRESLGDEHQPGILCSCEGRNLRGADVREALNVSAAYWTTTDYEPSRISENLSRGAIPLPILPTPWVQMGWGFVGNDTWRTMVEALQGNPPPPKPDAARAYMAQQHALREAYWSQRSPVG